MIGRVRARGGATSTNGRERVVRRGKRHDMSRTHRRSTNERVRVL